MNEYQNVQGWTPLDAMMQTGINSRRGRSVDSLRAECQRILKINPDYRAATYFDTHLNTAKRRAIYMFAGIAVPQSASFDANGKPIPHGDDFVNRPLMTLPKNERQRLLLAIDEGAEMFAGVRGGLNA